MTLHSVSLMLTDRKAGEMWKLLDEQSRHARDVDEQRDRRRGKRQQ